MRWVKGRICISDNDITKLGDLDYGQTRLIMAVPNDSPYENLTDFSEKIKIETLQYYVLQNIQI